MSRFISPLLRGGLSSIAVAVLFAMPVQAGTVVWRNLPITLDLVVGGEQMILLPGNGSVGLPPPLSSQQVLKTLSNNGTVYLTALEAFDVERVQVRLDNGEFILIDVSARVEKAPPATLEPLHIVLDRADADKRLSQAEAKGAQNSYPLSGAADERGPATLFELIRYAAQDLYSPKRLVSAVSGIRPVPVGITGNYTAMYDQGRHRGLLIHPHKAWSAGGLYVTAFIVTNKHTHPVILDNRRVQHTANAQRSGVAPHFVASAFFHREVAPRDQEGNQTTLFIVTDKPIRRTLGRLDVSGIRAMAEEGGSHGG